MVRAEARQILERLYNGEKCENEDMGLVLSQAMSSIDALEAHRSHLHKFGYVKGEDGKCACAYCVGDAEALANYAADLEMKNHTLQERMEAAEAKLAALPPPVGSRDEPTAEEKVHAAQAMMDQLAEFDDGAGPLTLDLRAQIIEAARNEWANGPQNIEGRIAHASAAAALRIFHERCQGRHWWTIGAADELEQFLTELESRQP